MTSIPGTDLTTEAARNRATRMLNEQDAALMVALANALDQDQSNMRTAFDRGVRAAVDHAKTIAARDRYTPQEAAAAGDVVDALQTLLTAGEKITTDPTDDDRDGKQIARAAEWVGEGTDDDECD